ncbi:PTS sugar transporter subunit IIB [Carnobacterium mobile]|uniref:PTS sugar transporter subunit IIB n=1 Tax=Carnobacterium mobile TaxID=2750 RepID=UPI000552D458|nr:PTS sugar transporter subunit IIB [Carnobacterium mobile]
MNVIMVCSGGMSSTIVVKAIKKEADKQGLDLDIKAVGSGEVEEELKNEKYDLLLVAPQVKHRFAAFETYANEAGVPIEKVEPMGYTPIGAPKTLETIKKYQ